MCWMCDHPSATFDDYLQEVVRPTIALCGYAVQATTWRGQPMAYTVGRSEQGETSHSTPCSRRIPKIHLRSGKACVKPQAGSRHASWQEAATCTTPSGRP